MVLVFVLVVVLVALQSEFLKLRVAVALQYSVAELRHLPARVSEWQ